MSPSPSSGDRSRPTSWCHPTPGSCFRQAPASPSAPGRRRLWKAAPRGQVRLHRARALQRRPHALRVLSRCRNRHHSCPARRYRSSTAAIVTVPVLFCEPAWIVSVSRRMREVPGIRRAYRRRRHLDRGILARPSVETRGHRRLTAVLVDRHRIQHQARHRRRVVVTDRQRQRRIRRRCPAHSPGC